MLQLSATEGVQQTCGPGCRSAVWALREFDEARPWLEQMMLWPFRELARKLGIPAGKFCDDALIEHSGAKRGPVAHERRNEHLCVSWCDAATPCDRSSKTTANGQGRMFKSL